MEKVCSVTLSKMNIYCCLVCGKFLEGRGKDTPAYTHSVQHDHMVYMNIQEERFYCLPDNYEVIDSSLDDIKQYLSPQYNKKTIEQLDNNKDLSRDVYGVSYLQGFIGINNISQTDYINATIRALSHVSILRNFLLQPDLYKICKSQLVQNVGAVMRRIWSPYNIRSCISPQELVNVISTLSKKRFANNGANGTIIECMDFLNWFLNEMHRGLTIGCASKGVLPAIAAKEPSTITQCFQGVIEVTEQRRKAAVAAIAANANSTSSSSSTSNENDDEQEQPWTETVRQVKFNHLSLDIPPPPLFQDGEEELIIPQVPIFELLSKFDGNKWSETLIGEEHVRRKYKILKLPIYLILNLIRITDTTGFRKARNPTIVTFPLRHLDMNSVANITSTATTTACPTIEEISQMTTAKELKNVVLNYGTTQQQSQLRGCDKTDLMAIAVDVCTKLIQQSNNIIDRCQGKYKLLSNICRNSIQTAALQGISVGAATESTLSRVMIQSTNPFKVHLQNKATSQWYELEDLIVTEVEPQQIGVSESSILIYEKEQA